MADPSLQLLFAGTPEFAATALNALLDSAHVVRAVYTQPDRPAGRGRKCQPSPVKIVAEAHHLPVFQPETLRERSELLRMRDFGVDVMVVVAYGLILPQAILRTPRWGCLNIHASLLPRWRGAAPIQRALLNGDSETGITIMRMARRLDSGPLLLRRVCPILATDTAATLHERLAALGAQALVAALHHLTAGTLTPAPQDETQATYAAKLAKTEAWLDWRHSAPQLERQVRAFQPYPIAQTQSGPTVIRVWQASVAHEITPPPGITPGTILAAERGGVFIATGAGVLILHKIQLPGARPLAISEVLNAHARIFQPGIILTQVATYAPFSSLPLGAGPE